jgi:hypothetical protein
MNSADDLQETIALTFWETKEDMDTYNKLNNKWFNIITERIKPLFERFPERSNILYLIIRNYFHFKLL